MHRNAWPPGGRSRRPSAAKRVAIAGVAFVTLAGCDNSAPASKAMPSRPAVAQSHAAPAPSEPTSQTPTTPGGEHRSNGPSLETTTAARYVAQECSAGQLKIGHSIVSLLQGWRISGYSIENISSTSCWVSGYPRVTLYNSSNKPIKLAQVNGHTEYGQPSTDRTHFVLARDHSIGWNIQFRPTGTGCWEAMRMAITQAPGAKVTSISTADSRPLSGCGTTLRVAAYFPPVFSNS